MFDWDDVRIFIAAARAGSLATAAQRLGIDAATVGRRVARLETALKSTLVVRSASGLLLTAAGAQLLETALDAESAMEAAERVTRPDLIAGAKLFVGSTDGFMPYGDRPDSLKRGLIARIPTLENLKDLP